MINILLLMDKRDDSTTGKMLSSNFYGWIPLKGHRPIVSPQAQLSHCVEAVWNQSFVGATLLLLALCWKNGGELAV